jgi:electron transfer flavoprotein alpha subunit
VQEDRGTDVAWELIGKARELAGKLETQVFGFLLGAGVKSIAAEAIAYGCDVVYIMDDVSLQKYLPKVFGQALVEMCRRVSPEILLLGATHLGRDLSSVVATRLQTGLTADCTGLDVDPATRLLLMTRPTFGGNIMATILCRDRRPQMSTVRPRVMKMPDKDPTRRGEIRPLDFQPDLKDLPQIIDFIPKAVAGGVDITRAPVLVVRHHRLLPRCGGDGPPPLHPPGRPDGQDRRPQTLYRRGRLGGGATPGRHPGLTENHRYQHRPPRAAGADSRLRHHRRLPGGRPGAD